MLARIRERYMNDELCSTQQVIDFLMDNYGFASTGNIHIMKDEKNKYDHENSDYFAVVTPLGVFFCEQEKDYVDVTVFNTYLPQEMLRKEQNRKIAIEYFKVYCEEYMKRNATNAEMVKNQYEQLILTSTLEHWNIDKFIDESNKYMDEHPLYVI
jgi:predicted nuclease of restriction endonuclease-like RecB superfamily